MPRSAPLISVAALSPPLIQLRTRRLQEAWLCLLCEFPRARSVWQADYASASAFGFIRALQADEWITAEEYQVMNAALEKAGTDTLRRLQRAKS